MSKGKITDYASTQMDQNNAIMGMGSESEIDMFAHAIQMANQPSSDSPKISLLAAKKLNDQHLNEIKQQKWLQVCKETQVFRHENMQTKLLNQQRNRQEQDIKLDEVKK